MRYRGYDIRYEYTHYVIELNGDFEGTADTVEEAKEMIDEMLGGNKND